MPMKQPRPLVAAFCFLLCMVFAVCGGCAAETADSRPASRELPDPAAGIAAGDGSGMAVPGVPGPAAPAAAPLENAAPAPPPAQTQAPAFASGANTAPAPAPIWQPLAQRLAADGLSGPEVDRLLAGLGPTPTQSPMGRKIRELYMRQFFPKPPSKAPQYYKGVVTVENARRCREFIAAHQAAFALAESRYGVPPAVAASLLFVETRLGSILADVPDNALYTLASMAVSREVQSINEWLPRLPGHEVHLDWIAETMPKRADWAYKEVRALVQHILRDGIAPGDLHSSIYGAVGICQFMPSNIAAYGADGDNDGRVDLFNVPDAVASLAHYLAKHGWQAGLPREKQHRLLMTYNHSKTYADTILALSDLVYPPAAAPAGAEKKRKNRSAAPR